MKKMIISRAEHARVLEKMERLKADDAVATAELADTTNNGAETWHDNAGFDAAKDKKNLAELMMAKLSYFTEFGEIVDPDGRTVEVGTCVRYSNQDSGEETEICIAGDAAWLMSGEWASHQAPLAMLLLGAKEDEQRVGIIGPHEVTLRVISIRALQG